MDYLMVLCTEPFIAIDPDTQEFESSDVSRCQYLGTTCFLSRGILRGSNTSSGTPGYNVALVFTAQKSQASVERS